MSRKVMHSYLSACIVASMVLSGCATSSKDITAAYISPMQFNHYDCDQIAAENDRLVRRVTELGARLDQAADNDKALTAVGAILFWPALFALGGTKDKEAEYARLKGEHEALQQASTQKKCALPPPIKQEQKIEAEIKSQSASITP